MSTHELVIEDGGFDGFSAGRLGNSGHNLYVSRAGILQRIQYSSIMGDGYVDLPFANSHDDSPQVPLYLFESPLDGGIPVELQTHGAYAGASADLTGNGYDDIVIANQFNGSTTQVPAQIYFGGPDGYSSRAMIELWAPSSKDVAIGRFSGLTPQIVFVSTEKLRFFERTAFGFVSSQYTELVPEHDIESIVTADLTGDGYDDLIIRSTDSAIRVYWGGPDGINLCDHSLIDVELTGSSTVGAGIDLAASGSSLVPRPGDDSSASDENADASLPAGSFIYGVPENNRLKIVERNGRPHLFLCPGDETLLISFDALRIASTALRLRTGPAMSIAIGDVRGTGGNDIVIVTRQPTSNSLLASHDSFVFWDDGYGGYDAENRSVFTTQGANDVAVVDIAGRGKPDIVVCQDKTVRMFTSESLIYRWAQNSLTVEAQLPTHCALDLLLIHPWGDDRIRPLFVNHVANSILGDIDSDIYIGSADGFAVERKMSLRGWSATELKFVDLFDGGRPDILMVNSSENDPDGHHGSFIFRNSNGSFGPLPDIELATVDAMSCVVADFDQNGYLDIVAAGPLQDHLLYFKGSASGFHAPVRLSLTVNGTTHNQPRFMSVADVDQSGYLDLVVPELSEPGGVIILHGGPHGLSDGEPTFIPSGRVVSSRIADLNGNGWLDLILGGFKSEDSVDPFRTSVYIYWGGPDGFSNDRRTQLPAQFAVDLTVADFSNNGFLDIFVANYHSLRTRDIDSFLYWNSESGFNPDNMTPLRHHSAAGALAADFNNSGWVDLAVANHKTAGNHPGDSFVWWNGPEGFSDRNRTGLPTGGPHGITHADIGNVYDRSSNEYFYSRIFDLDQIRRPPGGSLAKLESVSVNWNATVPVGTWVRAQVRSAARTEDLDAAEWSGGEVSNTCADGNESIPLQPGAQVVQYRLTLGARNSTASPRVSSVSLTFRQTP